MASIDITKRRSISQTSLTNFIPIVSYKQYIGSHEKLYLDYLQAKYIHGLKQITEYALYTVGQATAYRPEKISFDNYGTIDHWRVICFYNKIIHPMRDLYPSRVLRIPSFQQVTELFQRMSEKESNIGRIITI